MKFLGAEILQSIIAFFQTIRGSITLEHLMYIFVGLEILTIIVFVIIASNVYEVRLMRSVDKLNAYLYNVQYVDDSNLIEFNNRMKRVPKTLRYHWQQYMLYREQAPSYYMSIENCIDRPTKASAFEANIKVAKTLGILYAIISFLFCCGWAAGLSAVSTDYFITIFTIPLIILLLNYLLNIGLNLKRAANTKDLYQTFYIFNRFIDKAVVTLPGYVDFEVLFTRKEIQKGIPVLNEYIERRQIQEQEEMRKAKENAVQHEMYNFEDAEEKGELVLERAMKETEILISLKNRLNAEIEQIEKEIESYKRAYDNTSRDYQKKMQASRENVERLREQQEATTNRIESNYIRKQQSDEIKKQQQIEKEQEDATLRFNQEINTLAAEIQKRKTELEEARQSVEKSMLAEYKTYANKVFVEVKNEANKKVKEERDNLISSREVIAKELEVCLSKSEQLEKQNKLLVTKSAERDAFVRAEVGKDNEILKQKISDLEEIISEKDQHIALISENPNAKIKDRKYESLSGAKVKGAVAEKKAKDKEAVIIEGAFSFDDAKEREVVELADEKKIKETEPSLKEAIGQFDNEGNFRYPNGSYYDPKGYFHDENGDVFDPQGNLVSGTKSTVIKEAIESLFDDFSIFDPDNDKDKSSENRDNITEKKSDEIEKEESVKKEGVSAALSKEEIQPPKMEDIAVKKEDKVEEAPKKPRGRPRKVVEQNATEQPKRPRGRPRKVVTEVTPQPKRGRGRPRKVVIEDVAPQPKRPRGRPRKEEASSTVKSDIKSDRSKKIDVDDLKAIEEKLKKQNDILKTQQAELKDTIKKVTKSGSDKK